MFKKRLLLAYILCSLFIVISCDNNKTQYLDGEYFNYSEADNYGFASAKVTINDNKIVNVQLTEYNERGQPKDMSTYPYQPTIRGFEVMAQRFVEKNTADVDIYTGSTHSSKKYIDAVNKCLLLATANGEEKLNAQYFDGTFLGTSPINDEHYGLAWVSIENDKIIDISIEEVVYLNFVNWEVGEYKELAELREQFQNIVINAGHLNVDFNASPNVDLWQQASQNALDRASINK